MIFTESLSVESTRQHEVLDITDRINRLLKRNHVDKGIINLWTVHTTAALTVNENDDALWSDLLNIFAQLIPIKGNYNHQPNAHAHIISSILKPNITIPIEEGSMVLGTWQRILLLELDGPRKRNIKITIISE